MDTLRAPNKPPRTMLQSPPRRSDETPIHDGMRHPRADVPRIADEGCLVPNAARRTCEIDVLRRHDVADVVGVEPGGKAVRPKRGRGAIEPAQPAIVVWPNSDIRGSSQQRDRSVHVHLPHLTVYS